jgi:uncharacterized protein YjbI with pentapeptide repeats
MDRNEALKLLKGGPVGIRKWNARREEGERMPHLSGLELSGANLWEVDLSRSNLSGSNLSGSDLSEVNLIQATLTNTDLSGANLYKGVLIGASLYTANLSGADLTSVMCHSTTFADVDLSETKGLESIRHLGPSSVGVDTLLKSRGRIPKSFLLGCGLPDTLIDYLPSLLSATQPTQFYSCFISHSSTDKDFARRLYSRMREEGLRVWFDEIDMQSGKKLHEQIDKAIQVHDRLLIVLSAASMGSEWVKTELRKAFKQERREGKRKLFPIGLVPYNAVRDWECFDADHGKDLAVELREYFIPDFSNWKDHDAFEAGFARLLRDLKTEGPPAA